MNRKEFTKENLDGCLEILEDRQSIYPLRFDEIKRACMDARQSRETTSIGVKLKDKILFLKSK